MRRAKLAVKFFNLTPSRLARSYRAFSSDQPPTVKLLINGQFQESETKEWVDVVNPATQAVVSRLPLTTSAEFGAAVEAAKAAFPSWRDTPGHPCARAMSKLQQLIREHMVECVEVAAGIGHMMMGEHLENVASGIDCYSIRQPLGVVAGNLSLQLPRNGAAVDVPHGHCIR
eukprot:gene19241-25870_t